MSKLRAELQRLYLPHDAGRPGAAAQERDLVGADGRVRAMVLELARPAPWEGLARVWQGVQADLELPAPAIAVAGIDSYQLWFSLSEPVPAAQAMAFLEALRARYLGEVARERIGIKPWAQASAPTHIQHLGVLPPAEAAPGQWSAFVAPDLAALFADEPWLDLPPSPDAQADLLARIHSARPDAFRRAIERLAPVSASSTPSAAASARAPAAAGAGQEGPSEPATEHQDPKRFLLGIMNDRAIELHLRIEAAKALLPYA